MWTPHSMRPRPNSDLFLKCIAISDWWSCKVSWNFKLFPKLMTFKFKWLKLKETQSWHLMNKCYYSMNVLVYQAWCCWGVFERNGIVNSEYSHPSVRWKNSNVTWMFFLSNIIVQYCFWNKCIGCLFVAWNRISHGLLLYCCKIRTFWSTR